MSTSPEDPPAQEYWLEVVKAKAAAIRFGSVQITVHEGRVTQVEAVEKTRFGADRPEPPTRPLQAPKP